MRITVKLFAAARERAGMPETALDLAPGATVADAAAALEARFPALGELASGVAYAVNRAYAKPMAVLSSGDELAVIPPVSGG